MFARSGDLIAIDLAPHERAFMGTLPSMLDDVGTTDPGHAVLHRDAYDDAERSAEFADLVASDRARVRAEDRTVATRVGEGATSLSEQEARSLLRCINEARLVLSARAGLFDEGPGWEERMDRDPTAAAVGWLGYVQSLLIEALDRGP